MNFKDCVDLKIDFSEDIFDNLDYLKTKISNKNILVIGGAGTIGSNYIKELLIFQPRKMLKTL